MAAGKYSFFHAPKDNSFEVAKAQQIEKRKPFDLNQVELALHKAIQSKEAYAKEITLPSGSVNNKVAEALKRMKLLRAAALKLTQAEQSQQKTVPSLTRRGSTE